ncbi:hypothetical protein [Vibrio hepatarius]|uniref:hypothetical protein n=1 Tax=Vibrio hepatarius TaxID=171383 RepID=UPI001C12516D|nr:hypothetical protein [Vibrio hepatarius]
MSELLRLYVTSHQTGELLGNREAVRDVKRPERWVIPPYHTPTAPPKESLDDNEYWAFMDSNGQPVRDYQLGGWMKKKRHIKVTAYLKSDATKQKVFDDVSLVTDEYTLEKPLTQWDEWINDTWITNEANKYIAEYDQVDSARRSAYREVSDPLYIEAWRKESKGLVDEAAEFRQQADAAVELIQAENPWPTPPTN